MLTYKFIVESGLFLGLRAIQTHFSKITFRDKHSCKIFCYTASSVYNRIWCPIEIYTESFKYVLAQTFWDLGRLLFKELEDHVAGWNWWSIDIWMVSHFIPLNTKVMPMCSAVTKSPLTRCGFRKGVILRSYSNN